MHEAVPDKYIYFIFLKVQDYFRRQISIYKKKKGKKCFYNKVLLL